jgi:pimeloyl-ACP methyl ester carboxylesterase
MTPPPNSIRLRDSRRLAYAEYGAPRGKPVFFFHGIPGSRLYRPPDEITAKMGVRLICVDRPGYGLSDFQPGRRILDWPNDILELAGALGLERFAVAAHSAGAPYAYACAATFPDRVTVAGILSGAAPADSPRALRGMRGLNRAGYVFGRWIPWPLWRLAIWAFFHTGRDDPASVFERGKKSRPPSDQNLWYRSEVREVCLASGAEGFRNGTLGHAWETRLLLRPWGFRLEDIQVPVYLWHGTEDHETPISMARESARRLPDCRATICEGEGHSLLFAHWEEILRQLVGDEPT